MDEIIINSNKNLYKVHVEKDFSKINLAFKENNITNKNKIFLITDSRVEKLYNNKIEVLKKEYNCRVYSFLYGEEHKNYGTIEEIYNFLIDNNADRDSILIAFGGGVVGDLVGFVASTYMRGISYVNIPTTLVSQVDSSVGGKVGYNLNNVKNVIGSFCNPKFVYIDVNFLTTLNKDHILDGLGEVVKYGLIKDSTLIDFLEEKHNEILDINNEALIYIVKECLKIKSKVISEDFKDVGYRNILNFGHTVAHGIEVVSDYKISHGCAVALGMLVDLQLSIEKYNLDASLYKRIKNLYEKLGLPTSYKVDNYDMFLYAIKHDKKNIKDKISFTLLENIEKCKIKVFIEAEEVLKAIDESIGRRFEK